MCNIDMYNKAFAVLTVVSLLLACPGCGPSVSADLTPTATVCPDTQVQGDRMIFSTIPYAEGLPENAATVFQNSIPVIHSTFWLTADLCCTKLFLVCETEEKTIFQWEADGWESEGQSAPRAQGVMIKAPPGGFKQGDYTVTVFIDIREVLKLEFQVI